MNFKLFILLVLLASNVSVAKVNKDFSLAVELENDTLDLSDPNLPKGYDNSSYYYFWAKAVITNESLSAKKLTTWSCSGAGFKVESDCVKNAVVCKKNFPKTILLQPKESYKIPLYLSLKKNYTGDTLKFRIRYPMAAIGWSEFVTMKLRR